MIGSSLIILKSKLKRSATFWYDKILYYYARLTSVWIWHKLRNYNPKYKCIYICNVNFCNAKCVFCGQHKFKRVKNVMSSLTYAKILDQAWINGIREIDFTPTLGDPLLDPELEDKLSYAKIKGFTKIYMTTNGILLNKWKGRLGYVDFMRFSIGGFNSADYKEAYNVDKFEEVYSGILDFQNYKLDHQHVHLFIRSGAEERKILKASKFVNIAYRKNTTFEFTNLYDNWGGAIKENELVGKMKMRAAKKKTGVPCYSLNVFFVNPDGKARLCGCRMKDREDDELVIGDIGNESWKNVFNSGKQREILNKFKLGAELPSICKDCTLYRPMV